MDSERSIVFDQAENRLHAQKGILVWLTYPTVKRDPSDELRGFHEGRVQSFLSEVGWDRASSAHTGYRFHDRASEPSTAYPTTSTDHAPEPTAADEEEDR